MNSSDDDSQRASAARDGGVSRQRGDHFAWCILRSERTTSEGAYAKLVAQRLQDALEAQGLDPEAAEDVDGIWALRVSSDDILVRIYVRAEQGPVWSVSIAPHVEKPFGWLVRGRRRKEKELLADRIGAVTASVLPAHFHTVRWSNRRPRGDMQHG